MDADTTIGSRIRSAREEKGYTQTQLGELLGYKKNTISNWENDIFLPNTEVLRRLCVTLGTTADDILALPRCSSAVFDREARELIRDYRRLDMYGKKHVRNIIAVELERGESRRDTVLLRLYDQSASAGFGDYLDDSDSYETVSVLSTPQTRRCDLLIRVDGDSMEPELSDGDLLLISACDKIGEGETGVFIVNGSGYVKVLGRGRLISRNPAYKDIILSADDDVRCIGRVLGRLSQEELPG